MEYCKRQPRLTMQPALRGLPIAAVPCLSLSAARSSNASLLFINVLCKAASKQFSMSFRASSAPMYVDAEYSKPHRYRQDMMPEHTWTLLLVVPWMSPDLEVLFDGTIRLASASRPISNPTSGSSSQTSSHCLQLLDGALEIYKVRSAFAEH